VLLTAFVLLLGIAPAAAGTGVIFMYHHVSPVVQPGIYQRALTVTPDEFEQQLRWLRTRGCELVTVDRVWSDAVHGILSPCEAALTFDDGYADVAQYAIPLLLKDDAPATLYISTGFVGSPGHLTVARIRTAHQLGMEIGAHTINHVDLTKISHASAQREIEGSQRALDAWLGTPVSTFAYPAGSVNPRVAAAVATAHFVNAVTTAPGTIKPADNPYELPRYRVLRGQGIALLASVLGHAIVPTVHSWLALVHIARERVEGNDSKVAEAIAVALLARQFPEQIVKVHVDAVAPATVAGIVLSGVKFHAAVSRERFVSDVRKMVDTVFSAAPTVDEVDVWATVPVSVPAQATVSGDYAAAVERTVFSAAVQKYAHASVDWPLGITYWSAGWL
jgi:peptidoglycan/xylan/chitin deacetylase (PgdA/CDA1 family)